MSRLNNSILWLKGGVWIEMEKHLVQMEDKLFNLAGQIVVLMQTTPCSMRKEQTLATL